MTAVCVGNGTWLPNVSCGQNVSTERPGMYYLAHYYTQKEGCLSCIVPFRFCSLTMSYLLWMVIHFALVYVIRTLSIFIQGSSTFVILAIVFSIIGVFGAIIVGALVVYGCYKWKLPHQSKLPSSQPPSCPPPPAPVPSPPPPAQLYEDIQISTVKCEVNENVAYRITGQTKHES